ncbi:MAG: DUF2264 domain-containing protein [Bernardetiaceae bacterium]|jgi:hypothetical protein|nr:DUF2264 domain-containing protein [Bernardetiaceae bacterium]
MMRRRHFIARTALAAAASGLSPAVAAAPPPTDREFWLQTLTKLAAPVLENLAQGELKKRMPVATRRPEGQAERAKYAHLEAFGRLLCGLAPWLQLPATGTSAEDALRQRYLDLARQGLARAVDPASPDYMNFDQGSQPLVDASFLAYALLAAPVLWQRSDETTRRRLVEALRRTRTIVPYRNNWLLFSAMIEVFFLQIGEAHDAMRIDYALRQHEAWYKGDGVYGDGRHFHWDYYNSYVIQPYLMTILPIVQAKENRYAEFWDSVQAHAERFAVVQERMIAPDGSFPLLGRSLAYRCGAFHHLAHQALRKRLPSTLPPGQVRAALTAVIRRCLQAPANFDADGWLRLGLNGYQPQLAEDYICTGSLYLCATALLPLGLPPTDPFWAEPAREWTSRQVWELGQDLPADAAISK